MSAPPAEAKNTGAASAAAAAPPQQPLQWQSLIGEQDSGKIWERVLSLLPFNQQRELSCLTHLGGLTVAFTTAPAFISSRDEWHEESQCHCGVPLTAAACFGADQNCHS